MGARTLAVDDEPEITNLVEICLESEGCIMLKCGTGTETSTVMRAQALNLVILDVMLPDVNGFILCGEVCKEHCFPILMFTAKVEDMDKVIGPTIGADDYITKPFDLLGLMARVKAQLHRYTRYNETDKADDCRDIIDSNGLVINRAIRECILYNRELGLTPIGLDILWMLRENQGQVISAGRLFESAWGEKYLDRSNIVMVHIRRLWEEMGESSHNPWFIRIVWDVGYKID